MVVSGVQSIQDIRVINMPNPSRSHTLGVTTLILVLEIDHPAIDPAEETLSGEIK